jgi:hypothetical protein
VVSFRRRLRVRGCGVVCGARCVRRRGRWSDREGGMRAGSRSWLWHLPRILSHVTTVRPSRVLRVRPLPA